jgi:hypothetical protein
MHGSACGYGDILRTDAKDLNLAAKMFGRFTTGVVEGGILCDIPLLAIFTLLLPFAAICLNRFRIPLWSWFVWTAIIAVELSFYLSQR